MRPGQRRDLGIEVVRADAKGGGLVDQIADGAQEALIFRRVDRPAAPVLVPDVDRPLKPVAFPQQRGVARGEVGEDTIHAPPEVMCVQPRARQDLVVDKALQGGVDDDADGAGRCVHEG